MDKENLPRICYILGGEDNPIKINEEFKIKDYLGIRYAICSGGNVRAKWNGNDWVDMQDQGALEHVINHPEKIIRLLQFSDDEKAFLRLLSGLGYKYVVRDKSNNLFSFFEKPSCTNGHFSYTGNHYEYLNPEFFKQITFKNSPIEISEYMED